MHDLCNSHQKSPSTGSCETSVFSELWEGWVAGHFFGTLCHGLFCVSFFTRRSISKHCGGMLSSKPEVQLTFGTKNKSLRYIYTPFPIGHLPSPLATEKKEKTNHQTGTIRWMRMELRIKLQLRWSQSD